MGGETGRMIQIDNDGNVLEDFVLPTVQGHTQYPFNVAVSHDGARIAYTVTNPDMMVSQLLVYDTNTDSMIAAYSPGQVFSTTIDFDSGSTIFNEFDNVLVFSHAALGEGWQMVIFNIEGNTVTAQLSFNSPSVTALGINQNMLPTIVDYRNSEVTFSMVPVASEGIVTQESYTWNLVDNTVRVSGQFPSLSTDYYEPADEYVMSALDDRLPNLVDSVPFGYHLNTLQVVLPEQGYRFPFVASASESYLSPEFVEGGRLVVTLVDDLSQGFGEGTSRWLLLQRDGTEVGEVPIDPIVRQVYGTNEGFFYVVPSLDEQHAVVEVDTRDTTRLGFGRLVWNSPANMNPRVVWVQSNEANAVPFIAQPWSQVAPPIISGSANVTPGELPTATPFIQTGAQLTIGGLAIINTTEGDPLNIRSGPGLSFDRVRQAEDGTQVTVIEGPVAVDGFTWWRVQFSDGLTGWAVEAADNVKTLLPTN